MKRIIMSTAAILVFTGLSCLTTTARAQNGGTEEAPHKIGLIDMAEVFKNYKKFEALREDLKSEIEATDRKAKAMAAEAQKLQNEMKKSPFKEGTPEFKRMEDRLIQMQADFNSFKAQAQRDFMRKESQIYKTVYLEASDAVAKYAEFFKYTLILRFNRKSLVDADSSKGILNSMNKQVIYHRPEDDITDSVVDYLNKLYARAQGGTSSARNPKSGTRSN